MQGPRGGAACLVFLCAPLEFKASPAAAFSVTNAVASSLLILRSLEVFVLQRDAKMSVGGRNKPAGRSS